MRSNNNYFCDTYCISFKLYVMLCYIIHEAYMVITRWTVSFQQKLT